MKYGCSRGKCYPAGGAEESLQAQGRRMWQQGPSGGGGAQWEGVLASVRGHEPLKRMYECPVRFVTCVEVQYGGGEQSKRDSTVVRFRPCSGSHEATG